MDIESARTCPTCNSITHITTVYDTMYPLVVFSANLFPLPINSTLKLANTDYTLKGLVYYGHSHFTSRLVAADGTMWFHDGADNGSEAIKDGDLTLISPSVLNKCRGKNIVMVVYTAKV